MNYLKFTQYAYLIAGILFAIDSFTRWQAKEDYIISGAFAAICVFMFIFRGNYAKKFSERNKKP
jgi:hypothetical protein